jgi:hypothetical protein
LKIGSSHSVQKAGLISYTRGRIKVLDRSGLEGRSCECYQVVKDEYDRLLPMQMAVSLRVLVSGAIESGLNYGIDPFQHSKISYQAWSRQSPTMPSIAGAGLALGAVRLFM